ncbi:MAG: hypothetical protein AAF990_21645, partial [Bacteroidota bacterium]
MSIVKIAAAIICCGTAILLFALTLNAEKSETVLYKETVEVLMQQEGLTSDQELEARFPILVEVQTNLARIAELKQLILDKVRSPAPTGSEQESQQMAYWQEKIHQLQAAVKAELSHL